MNTTSDGAEPYDQFKDEDDFQLVEWMVACRDDDPGIARAAWACLYRRHVAYLLKATSRKVRDAFGQDGETEDVVAEAFRKLFTNANTFVPPSEPLDADGKRRWFRAWLGQMAVNLIRDTQRNQQRLAICRIDQEQWADQADSIGPGVVSPDAAMLRQAMLDVLDDREQDILRTTYQYYDPATGKAPKLPPEEVRRLCEDHGITPENLRQIRARALRKLTEAVTRNRTPERVKTGAHG